MFKIQSTLKLLFFISSPICLLLPSSIATAELLGNYTVSSEPKKVEQRRTIGSGSRSDCQSNLPQNSVTLLVPEAEVVHQTSAPRPSFFFYSTIASKTPFKFTLVNPQVAEPIVETTIAVSQPGIKQIELPPSTVLEEGTVYLWYVAIPCSNAPQQYQEVLGAAVERVRPTERAVHQLKKANTLTETAAIYASNGIWYEALDLAIQAPSNSYLQQLLSSAGFSNLAPAENSP